jgi:hypothetical protein
MDKKDKEPKGTAATASKMAANNKNDVGGESPSPGQGATSSQNQGGTQNQGATGTQNQSGSITPQQNQGAVGSQHNQGATGSQHNQGTQGNGGQDLLQQAKQTTNEVVNQVQQQASSQLNHQKDTAAAELSTVVNAVRRFGETLNNEGQGPIARFAAQYGDKAAESLDRVAQYLREQDSKRLFNDVQSFGRRQPALLIGGAFLLGFAGARIIKSSMDAAGSSMNTGAQRAMNTGTRSSANPGAQQQQSFNTNLSGAQQTQQPAPPSPNPAL